MRTFSFYFKKGLELAKVSLKGKGFFTRILLGLYFILSTLGKLLFFTRPIFLISDNNLAMMAVEAHDIELNKLFEGINKKKRYSSLLLATLFIDGLILAAAIIFFVPFLVWSLIPSGSLTTFPAPTIMMYLGLVIVAAFAIVLVTIYSPIGFVAVKGKDTGVGDILFLASKGSKSTKGKVIGLTIVYGLIILVIIGVPVGLSILFNTMDYSNNDPMSVVMRIVILVLLIALVFLVLFVVAFFKFALANSYYSLFFDSVETKHIVVAARGTRDQFTPLFADDKEEI